MPVVGSGQGTSWNKTLIVALDDSPGLAVKASQGILHALAIINTTAAVAYVQIFDKAAVADVTLGTTTPDMVLGLSANQATYFADMDIVFTNGIVLFSTTTATGSTAAVTAGTAIWV